jgi:thiosulfate/3-mercaptopyruvate sulfurtransferase
LRGEEYSFFAEMTNINIPGSLVSVNWLAENLDAENLVILDASIKLVTPVQIGEQKARVYIPGALHFDIDHEMSDKNSTWEMKLKSFCNSEITKI